MRQLVHRLSNFITQFKFFKKITKSEILFFLILLFIFIQFLMFNPTDLSTNNVELKTAEQIKNLANSSQNKKSVEQKMSGIHLVENSNRIKGWELFAEEATGSADSQWILKKVRVEFFAEDQSSFKVTGDVGEIDGTTKDILIRGQVITTSTNGYLFKTNDLSYVANTKSLKSENTVEMTGPNDSSGSGFILNGIGFTIDLVKNKMSILDSVQAHKIINTKNFDLVSNQAIFSNKNQEGEFFGAVEMKYDKMLIQAPQALFKYSNQNKELKKILLKDKVTFKESERSGSCKELEIDLSSDVGGDRMTLRGQPKVQMNDDEITGQEIVFTNGGQKVKINNVKVNGQIKDQK